jgi:hypothetical protein
MEIKNNLGPNALRKVALLITKAADMGMDLGGYGFADENPHNGNVYLWMEDYNFTLYIPLGGPDRIMAVWDNPYTGDEEIEDTHDKTLHNLETWADSLTEAAEAAEEQAA